MKTCAELRKVGERTTTGQEEKKSAGRTQHENEGKRKGMNREGTNRREGKKRRRAIRQQVRKEITEPQGKAGQCGAKGRAEKQGPEESGEWRRRRADGG